VLELGCVSNRPFYLFVLWMWVGFVCSFCG
jgi:hypothetical protein